MQFAQRTCINASPESATKETYNTYGEYLNAIGKISYDALTGNTCFTVGLIPKVEQNVISPCSQSHRGGGGGLGNTMSVSFVPKPLGRPLVVFALTHMSGATTEMPNTLQPDQSFRRNYEL